MVEGATLDRTPQRVSQPGATTTSTRTAAPVPGTEAATAGANQGAAGAPGGGTLGLGTTGSSVTVVTGEDLRAQQIRHAADALRSLPGVAVSQSGAFGSLTQVRIRGAEGNHTLVVIDGIEANDLANDEFDFASLLADDIERIEVIRGPQSGLYGANALGGVINIVTKSGKGPAQVKLRGEGGSFDTGGIAASVSGGDDKRHGILSFQRRKTDGFNTSMFGNEDEGSDISNAVAKGGLQILPWLKVDGVFRRDENESDIDDFLPYAGAVIPFNGVYLPLDSNSSFDLTNQMAGSNVTATLLDGHWVQRFHADYSDTESENRSEANGFSKYDGDRTRFSYFSTLKGETPGFFDSHHAVTGMLETTDENFTPSHDRIERTRGTDSAAAEYRGEFYDLLGVTASLRHDDNDSFEDSTTYRVAGSLAVPNTPMRLHSSVGTAVVAPTMYELYGYVPNTFTPNPNLKPEESFGWDAGIEVSLMRGRLVVDVTYFEQDLENEITTAFLPNFTSSPVNMPGTSDRDGEEVSAAWEIVDGLTLSGAYTHLHATDPSGIREVRRPEHAGRVDVDYRFADDKAHLRLGVIYNGAMDDFVYTAYAPYTSITTLDSYTTVRLAGSYELRPGLEVFARAENLFDADYQEVFGYETAGAAVYGGLKLTLGGNGL
ncbi:TonB-dependent receptor [Methyloligella sp. 2.7D]|uniref:TonB-dependent receptor plug domain-containing protein n=1 Tax=unclassified Methyloligella TaxID=2625955 RepID=UPI00157D251A|nr:TonB-dependent receptor [Methyloligella sp. GL2]QKP77886.1 TonB-dependent receptor [Methyloligella sp. GL2]